MASGSPVPVRTCSTVESIWRWSTSHKPMIWHCSLAIASPRMLLPHQPQPMRAVRYFLEGASAPRMGKAEKAAVAVVEALRKLRRFMFMNGDSGSRCAFVKRDVDRRSEIDVVHFKRGWFGAKVRIRLKSMKWLAELPGCDHGEITLHVARRDRDQAGDFVRMLASA